MAPPRAILCPFPVRCPRCQGKLKPGARLHPAGGVHCGRCPALVYVLLCAPAHVAWVAEVEPKELAFWEQTGADVAAILADLGVPTLARAA